MATVKRFMRLASFVFPLLALGTIARAQNLALAPPVPVQQFLQNDPFDPVFATMTQQEGGDSPGCRGCHIGPAPGFGRWFGDTQDDVLDYFLNGEGMVLVSGGRESLLAGALGLIEGMQPFMPRDAPGDGRFWTDNPCLGLTELTDLGNWLDTIDF
jgi:hypothetical protein